MTGQSERPMRLAWGLLAIIGLVAAVPLEVLLFFRADLAFLAAYLTIVYGWPSLMLLIALMVSRWFSPWLLLVGVVPLVFAPMATGLDPIPWFAAFPYLGAVLVAFTEGPIILIETTRDRSAH